MNRDQETFATWNKIADLYASTFMDLDLYNDTYDLFLSSLPEGPIRVLEIGCGPGNITAYLLKRNPELQVEGIDVAPNMVALAKKNNPAATFQVMDARLVVQLATGYQGIISGFYLPYCSPEDRRKWMEDCWDLLVENGVFYMSFVLGDSGESGFITGSSGDRTYFYYHPMKDVLLEMEQIGFGGIQVITKEYVKSNGAMEEHKILLTTKKSSRLQGHSR